MDSKVTSAVRSNRGRLLFWPLHSNLNFQIPNLLVSLQELHELGCNFGTDTRDGLDLLNSSFA